MEENVEEVGSSVSSIDTALVKFMKMTAREFENYRCKNMGEIAARKLWIDATADDAPARLLQALIERIDGKVAPKTKASPSKSDSDVAERFKAALGGK